METRMDDAGRCEKRRRETRGQSNLTNCRSWLRMYVFIPLFIFYFFLRFGFKATGEFQYVASVGKGHMGAGRYPPPPTSEKIKKKPYYRLLLEGQQDSVA